jgi:NADH-quinone oxidoreductase subunit I
MTGMEPRGAVPLPHAHDDPGQARSQASPEPAGDPGLAIPGLAGGPELAIPGSAGLELDAGELPPRSRGVIGLLEENCTVCMLCARECPDWCIYIESHKQTVAAPEGGRPRVRNVLDRFAIDFSLCMYCGICIEVCPYDALFWSPEFGYPETGIDALTHERDRLRDWMWTVPSPPAHDPGAPLPREAQAAGPGADPGAESG